MGPTGTGRRGMITTSTVADLGGARTEVRTHQANVPDLVRPRGPARFASSLDRCATYRKICVP